MTRAADLCESSAAEHGIDQRVIYTELGLRRTDFYRQHQTLLDAERGKGFFVWKPYFINEEIQKLSDGTF